MIDQVCVGGSSTEGMTIILLRTDRICLTNFEYFTFKGERGVIGLKDREIKESTSGSQAHFIVKPLAY